MCDETIDLSGLECPIPVIRTKKKLAEMDSGQILCVICTDPLSRIDIPVFVTRSNYSLQENYIDDDKFIFKIQKWIVVQTILRIL